MPINNAELLDEFDTDPEAMGYKTAPVEADGYKSNRDLSALLGGRPDVVNPDGPAQIPKPMSSQALFNALDDAELAAITPEAMDILRDRIEADDRDSVKRYLKMAWKKAWISQARYNAFVTAVDATIDNPDHPANIPKPNTPRLKVRWNEGGITAEQIDNVLGRT